ncbi:hypothetical protein AWM75_00990 [Aerococcus urinaehominis]|uniref:Uncharacterized protein n=1 Tax=Aerococcus urinaehominis TaxID=128944 RepID=A0A0X8FJW5_9LACT|nr:MFS transporter [Aerococcus urinaehominis]AMB98655.1 hypothetical protein AWM75_00990 [Aerococcus urinaehominis]SDL97130.1 MFS transporter, PPP family, 3-phenylpropionic acid transporter [Aerococcus urinaehominis]
MKQSFKHLSTKYAGLMGSYNLGYAGFTGFGTVYLLSKGLNESQIGLAVALANLLAVFVQPVLAERIDRSRRWTLLEYKLALLIPLFFTMLAMLIANQLMWLIAVLFVLAMTLMMILMPLLNSVAMYFINHGYQLDYGVPRAIGSAFYAVGALIIGRLTVAYGTDAMVAFAIASFVIYSLVLFFFPFHQARDRAADQAPDHQDHIATPADVTDLPDAEPFFKKYRQYGYFLAGVLCFITFHNLVNNYMFQILVNVGGGQEHMGTAFALAAFIEVPVMVSYAWLSRRFSLRQLLMTSAIFFLVKAIITAFATGVPGIMLAQATQMLAFGIYTTVSVYYTNTVMAKQDMVKGQAMLATAQTIGNVLGSLVGGMIINHFSTQMALYFCIICCIFGLFGFYKGVKRPSLQVAE